MLRSLFLLALTIVLFSCDRECDNFDLSNEYNEVCDIIKSDELDIPCEDGLSFEGDVIGVKGKLDPDFMDYLNGYDPSFPDTWPVFFRVLHSTTDEEDRISEAKFIAEKVIQINLAHDGINASSFEPLKIQLEELFEGKAFATISVKGVARGVNQSTNITCNKGIVLEISDIADVIIE